MKEEQQAKAFPSRAREELHYAGKQFYKSVIIAIVWAILLYLSHFFSAGLTVAFALVGSILLLATVTYSVGHFVRFLIFSIRKR